MKRNTKRLIVCLTLTLILAASIMPCATADGDFSYPMAPVTLSINMDVVDRETIPDWALDYYIWDRRNAGSQRRQRSRQRQQRGHRAYDRLRPVSGHLSQ